MESRMNKLSVDQVRECWFEVEGKVFWKSRPQSHFDNASGCRIFNGRFANREAGNDNMQRGGLTSYRQIKVSISGVTYRIQAHTVVWILHHGKYPDNVIDHIDHDGLNNHISNLRDITQAENMKNLRPKTIVLADHALEIYPGIYFTERCKFND